MTSIKAINGKHSYLIEFEHGQTKNGSLDGKPFELDVVRDPSGSYHLLSNGKSYNVDLVNISFAEKKVELMINNTHYSFLIRDRYDELLERLGMDKLNETRVMNLKAPMPGMVLNIAVNGGSEVKKGDPLLVLEAMKMENILKSPTDGVIKEISVKKGEAVEKNQILLNFQ